MHASVAQTTRISNAVEGNWSDPSTWSNGVPQSGDNVVIVNNAEVFLDVSITLNTLTIGNSDNNGRSTLIILDNHLLTIEGQCYVHRGRLVNANYKAIIVGSRFLDEEEGDYIYGTGENTKLVINGDLVINANNNMESGIQLVGLASLELGGNMVLPNNRGYLTASDNSIVILRGTMAQQIYMAHETAIKYPNLTIDGHYVSITGSLTGEIGFVSGDLIVKNGTFNNSGRQIKVSRDIVVEGEASFHLSGGSTISVESGTNLVLDGKLVTEHVDGLGGFKPLGTINFGPESEIEYYGNTSGQFAGFQWFPAITGCSKLSFSNTVGTAMDKSITVEDLKINANGILNGNGSSPEIIVTNSWTNNGVFNGQTSTVRLAGTTSTLLGTGVNNFHNLIIDSGVDFSAPQTLTVSGSLTVNSGGNFNHNNGRVVFKPTGGAQQTTGVGQFWDVTVEGGVIFNGQDTINHELHLLNGTSSIENSASLSLNLNSGYISPGGSGGLNGNVHFFKNVSRNGFSYLAFPVPTTLQELKSNRLQNIYKFDEESTNPFVKESAGPVLAGGSGYVVHGSVNNGANLPIVRVTGAYNNVSSQVTVPVKSSPIEGELIEGITGWNLVGNPFAFDLDWDDIILNSSNSDLYSSLYLYVGGQYSSYVAGVPSGNNFIPSMQAFMVYLPNETGSSLSSSMVMSKSAGLGSSSALYRKAPVTNVLKLNVHKGDLSDATYVRLSDDASIDFDKTLDAIKMKNSGLLPSFYSYLGDAIYSINSIPATFSRFAMPLAFEAKEAGTYTIELSEEYTYDLPYEIHLEDKVMNVLHPIDSDRSYTFSTNLNESTERFVLHFENPVVTSLTGGDASFVKVFANGRDITVRGLQVEELAEICLYDIAGRLVARHSGVDLKNKSFNLRNDNTEGVYIVSIIAGSKTHSERVLIY